MSDCLISNGRRVAAFLEVVGEDARSNNGITQGAKPYRHLTRGEKASIEHHFRDMGRANQDGILSGMPQMADKLREEGHTEAASQVTELAGKLKTVAEEESRAGCAFRKTQETLSLQGKFETDHLKEFHEEKREFQNKVMDKIIHGNPEQGEGANGG